MRVLLPCLTASSTRRSPLRIAWAALVVAAGVIAPTTAHAHTGFDYSEPADGAEVGEPVGEIRVAFTDPVALVGEGFEVLTPEGEVVTPSAVTDDDLLFRLRFDPPLAGGAVGVRWEVTADDGHVQSGAFSFTVGAPLATSPPTTPPATGAPATPPATSPPTTPPTTGATPSSVGTAGSGDEGGSTVALGAVAAVAVLAVGAGVLVARARR